ncbi:MAG: L,D-transpeptidase [Chitinophagaceae bacterium]|nr:L,D-transpeptidase [Chitinophagaceae bacterium]
MSIKYRKKFLASLLFILWLIPSCDTVKKKKVLEDFKYESFRDSLNRDSTGITADTTNIFDASVFIPGIDSLDTLLKRIDTLWHQDIALMLRIDSLKSRGKNEKTVTSEEMATARSNINALDSFKNIRNIIVPVSCKEKECFLYAEINKSAQRLDLYIDGEWKDSFRVSTGKGKYETPNLNVRPSGPLFIKYTSRKFPGGNYQGLGNMPYAVFIRGGYAIHGTTPGNFSKLGTRASHGCIRLHPDNAKIFYELVKKVGLENTWVTIRDSL